MRVVDHKPQLTFITDRFGLSLFLTTGVNRYYGNLRDMIGYEPCGWWKMSWFVTLPFICASVFIYSLYDYKPLTYLDYQYPWWGELIGWFLALSSMLCIPVYAIYIYCKTPGTFQQRMQLLLRPDLTHVEEQIRKRVLLERSRASMTPV